MWSFQSRPGGCIRFNTGVQRGKTLTARPRAKPSAVISPQNRAAQAFRARVKRGGALCQIVFHILARRYRIRPAVEDWRQRNKRWVRRPCQIRPDLVVQFGNLNARNQAGQGETSSEYARAGQGVAFLQFYPVWNSDAQSTRVAQPSWLFSEQTFS